MTNYIKVLEEIVDYTLPVYTFQDRQFVPIEYAKQLKKFAQDELNKISNKKQKD